MDSGVKVKDLEAALARLQEPQLVFSRFHALQIALETYLT